MSANEVRLDDGTYATAKRLAEAKNVSIEELVSQAIERLSLGLAERGAPGSTEPGKAAPDGNIIGAMAEYAEVLDEIVDEAYRNRERRPIRLPSA